MIRKQATEGNAGHVHPIPAMARKSRADESERYKCTIIIPAVWSGPGGRSFHRVSTVISRVTAVA